MNHFLENLSALAALELEECLSQMAQYWQHCRVGSYHQGDKPPHNSCPFDQEGIVDWNNLARILPISGCALRFVATSEEAIQFCD